MVVNATPHGRPIREDAMGKKPRGWWNTSLRDKARAQYQADQIAAALPAERPASAAELNEAYRQGWREGREALLAEQAAARPSPSPRSQS